MGRLVVWVSGKVQKAGYRSKVVTIARDLGIKGSVQNLPDGRVKILAEGDEAGLQRFAEALKIRNAVIDVTDIKKERSIAVGDYEDFYKVVGEGETDEWLDKFAEYLKELVDVTRYGFSRMEIGFGDLGNKMDQMLDKQDQMLNKQDATIRAIQGLDSKMDHMLDKQDHMLDKQDETTGEIRGLRTDLKSHIDMKFQRIETDLAEVKTALKEKGLI